MFLPTTARLGCRTFLPWKAYHNLQPRVPPRHGWRQPATTPVYDAINQRGVPGERNGRNPKGNVVNFAHRCTLTLVPENTTERRPMDCADGSHIPTVPLFCAPNWLFRAAPLAHANRL
ncbi:fiber [Anopheles sinensis]|uniref:Fiber n=1 Tax=Anopheles sinensis TaxID=74873 RepID=A0A084VR78_ANOSI|nr:fiber [Anopheles sinensis]